MKSDLLYALSKGRLKTAVSGFTGFYYFRFLRILVSSVIGSVSEIPVRFPVSGSVHKFPARRLFLNRSSGYFGKSPPIYPVTWLPARIRFLDKLV